MFEKHVARLRALGLKDSLRYYLGTAGVERLGMLVLRSYRWPSSPRDDSDAPPAELTFEIVSRYEDMSPRDLEVLRAYGGDALTRSFSDSFERGWRCALSHDKGELTSVAWILRSSPYQAQDGKRAWLVQSCFTLPAHRGRKHYARLLRFVGSSLASQSPEVPVQVESAVWNTASMRGIEHAGFRPVGTRFEFRGTNVFVPNDDGHSIAWATLLRQISDGRARSQRR
ncbi:MAG: hypothetical protein Tsb0020_20670 [Haliangiales bacterium]